MEHCQVLTVLVDVVVQGKFLKEFSQIYERLFAVHKLSIPSCSVWFVVLWIVQWDETGQSQEL